MIHTRLGRGAVISEQVDCASRQGARINSILGCQTLDGLAKRIDVSTESQKISAQTCNVGRRHAGAGNGVGAAVEPGASNVDAGSEDIHASTVVGPVDECVVDGGGANGTDCRLRCRGVEG